MPMQAVFLLPPFLVDGGGGLLRLSKRMAHALQRDVHVAEQKRCVIINHIRLLFLMCETRRTAVVYKNEVLLFSDAFPHQTFHLGNYFVPVK